MARQKTRGKRQKARGSSEEGLGDFTFLYTDWFYCVHLLTNYEFQITNSKLRIPNYEFQIPNYELRINVVSAIWKIISSNVRNNSCSLYGLEK